MVWSGHCANGLLIYSIFWPKVSHFARFRIHLARKTTDWTQTILWLNVHVHAPHGYATWSLVWCSCAEIWRRFKISILGPTPNFWHLSHSISTRMKKDNKRYYGQVYLFMLFWLVLLACVDKCGIPWWFSKNRFFTQKCICNVKSPMQTAHNRSNGACMYSNQCILSTNTTITIIDWFVVELDLEMY